MRATWIYCREKKNSEDSIVAAEAFIEEGFHERKFL